MYMNVMRQRQVFYPHYPIGHEGPIVVPGFICIVKDEERYYVRTPFACWSVNYSETSDEIFDTTISRVIEQKGQIGGYYETEESCKEYCQQRYPNWRLAGPIMEFWATMRHVLGEWQGTNETCKVLLIYQDELTRIARGEKSVRESVIKECLDLIEQYEKEKRK